MDHMDKPNGEFPRLTPLLIGEYRVYFAHRTSSNGYDLVAKEFRCGRSLYQTPVIARIADGDHGCPSSNWDVLKLIQFGGNELIIQLNSDRLVSCNFGAPHHFTIINGANGQVIQKISHDGFSGCRTITKANSSTFAMVGLAHAPSREHPLDAVIIQTYSRQLDESFSRTAIQTVTMANDIAYTGSVTIHPFSLHAFSVRAGDSALKALTVARNLNIDDHREPDIALRNWSPPITVDGYYHVVAARALTLPPRQLNCGGGGSRRKLELTTQWNCGRLMLLDERRIVLVHSGSRAGPKYLLDFTPK